MKEIDVNSAVAGEIMTPYVVMLNIDASFQDLINTLHNHNISAVFIHDNDKNEYFIISQTDIINFLENGGMFKQNIANIKVTELMQGPIELLDVSTTVDKIIRFMSKNNYKRVLISKDGKAAGVISTRDIMKWNDTYFKPARPQILIFLDNLSSNFIAKHIFLHNINEIDIQHELIDLYGGAIHAISAMTNEIFKRSGDMSQLVKDKRSILFEPYQNITGILICDYNSIELRRKLQHATQQFFEINSRIITNAKEKKRGIVTTLKIDSVIPIFKER